MDTEHIFLLIMGLVGGIAATWLFEQILKTNKKFRKKYYEHPKFFWGYRIHHSTYGLVFIALNVALFFMDKKPNDLIYTAIGMGIIIMHTLSEGKFIFIEKQKN